MENKNPFLKPIEEDTRFCKNLDNKAIINKDKEGFRNALIRKKRNKQIAKLEKKLEQLSDKIIQLEKLILSNINNKN